MYPRPRQSSWIVIACLGLGLGACGSSTSAGSADGPTVSTGGSGGGGAGREDAALPDQGDGGSSGDSADDAGGSLPANDAGNPGDGTSGGSDTDASSAGNPEASDGATAGNFSCTFNATGAYPLGAEHRGYTIFGTVVDTTAGAGRARVGAFQNAPDTNDMVKFVWPAILAAGHTYEIALFEDHMKNRICAGTPDGTEPQWLFPVPAVTGDFVFNFMHNARSASCQDFPTGPVPP